MDNCCKYILINTFNQQTIQKVLRYNVTLVFFIKGPCLSLLKG